jgi:hypothetical protein
VAGRGAAGGLERGGQLGEAGAAALSDALKINATLTSLS